MNSLTTQESADLEGLERRIEAGLRTFYEVGAALTLIRDRKLYRAAHKTFERYCEERWGFGDDRARQMIAAAQVCANLKKPDNCRVLPANEHQASMLVDLTPDAQVVVWQQAVETAPKGRITAAHVAKTVEKVTGSPPGALPGETHPDVVAGLAALSPEARRELLACAEQERPSPRPTPAPKPPSDDDKDRRDQIRRLCERVRKLTEGLDDPDVDGHLGRLAAFVAAL